MALRRVSPPRTAPRLSPGPSIRPPSPARTAPSPVVPDLDRFAAEHGLAEVSISDLLHSALPPAKEQVRTVIGHFATGVTVVTTRCADGQPIGTTVNAVSSVSLEPPLLLVCLAEGSETLTALRDSSHFAINILAADQRHHPDRFAARGDLARPHEIEFAKHPLGVPTLPGSLATIACRVEAIHAAHDHQIVIGEALDLTSVGEAAEPLLFYRGSSITGGRETA